MAEIVLDCALCRTEKAMHPTKAGRFDIWLQVAGKILLIVTALTIFFGLASLLSMFHESVDAEFMFGCGSSLIVLGLLLVIPGCILTMKKKVYQCENCGHIIDRT